MADSNVSFLAMFDNGPDLNYLEKDGEIFFTAEEIGRHLGYADPAKSVAKLYERNKNELKLYSTTVKLTEMNHYNPLRVFTEEGVYILTMLARTKESKKFRARVALLLRRLRQEALQRRLSSARLEGASLALSFGPLDRARTLKAAAYRKRGFSQKETAAVMGLHKRAVWHLLQNAKDLGLLETGGGHEADQR